MDVTESRYKNRTEHFIATDDSVIRGAPAPRPTHGSLCAEVFAGQADVLPDISICLNADDSRKSNKSDLAAALMWCLAHKIRLINLSMGTTMFADAPELLKPAELLNEAGAVLIAAANNNGLITYPASFDCCVGVAFCARLESGGFVYIENPFDGVNVYTAPVILPDLQAPRSNSLSAAFVSGLIYRELGDSLSAKCAYEFLFKFSLKTGPRPLGVRKMGRYAVFVT